MDFPKVLPPGKAGTVRVKVETGKTPGEHVKSVTVKTNDPVTPNVLVELVFFTK